MSNPYYTIAHLKDFLFPDSNNLICVWDYLVINEDNRIYYRPNNQDNTSRDGFLFCLIENTSGELWDYENDEVECCYWGAATNEGLRCIHMGDKQTLNPGHVFWPDLDSHINFLAQLKALIDRYCQ